MSEQLERMESALTRIEAKVERLNTDVAELKADVAGLKANVVTLNSDVTGLKSDVGGLRADVARLEAGQVELGQHMRDLHREAMERIAALRPDWELFATKRDVADLKESIDRKLDPLIVVVSSHSKEIAALQRSPDAH